VLAATIPARVVTPVVTPVENPRRGRGPQIGGAAGPQTAPAGWPAPPEGDVLCASTLTGGEDGSGAGTVEVTIVLTDRDFTDVLDHFARALPEDLPFERHRDSDAERLWGHASGTLYAVEPAGRGRYALVFHVLAPAPAPVP